MNKSQEKYLTQYLGECLVALRMQNWRVGVSSKQADPGDVASVFMADGQRHAYVSIGEEFWGEDANEKRNTIGHELAHCKTRDMLAVVRRQLVELLGTGVLFRSIYKLIKDQEELLVDDLSTVFEAVLPPWEGP